MSGHAEQFVNLGIDGLSDAWRVGSGGSAAVFGARDNSGRPVAVKLLRWAVEPAEAERRFNQERRVLERLGDHPGVVPILGSGITNSGELYFTMPLLPGSMSQVVSQRGPMGWEQAASLTLDVARTIDFAHSNGVLHCDLKPANLLLSDNGRPMVADFGISRLTDEADTASTRMAVSPSYAAPERFRDEPVTVRSDVYSLASTFSALVTGRPPFTSRTTKDSPEQIMARVLRRPPPDLAVAAQVPRPVAAVISQAMSKDAMERPHSAAAFADQLRYAMVASGGRVEETITIDVPSSNAWERMAVQANTHDYKSRSAWLWAAAMLLPLALVAGLIWGLSGDGGDGGDDVATELGAVTSTPEVATATPTVPALETAQSVAAEVTARPVPTSTPVATSTPVPATATVAPTAEPSAEATVPVFPRLFQTPTPVPPTATPSPTSPPAPKPTATTRPQPTATTRPQPTATPRPQPTATSRPQPTVVPTATAVPSRDCPTGWSGPNAAGNCTQTAPAERTPRLVIYSCPRGTDGNPTPDDPTCSGTETQSVAADRTERLVCPPGTTGSPTPGAPYCYGPSSVDTSQIALQVHYAPTYVCQLGSTGSPTAGDPTCLTPDGLSISAVVNQQPSDLVCRNGATPQADFTCPVSTSGERVFANLEISLRCPNGSSGTPTFANPSCTGSRTTRVAARVVQNTPGGWVCPAGFSGSPTTANPVCLRSQPAT